MIPMGTLLLSLMLALPSAERCAAMLLSPGEEMRKAAKAALADAGSAKYNAAVLEVLAERAHSRTAWIAVLEKELSDSSGPRHKEVRELLRILKGSTEDNIGVDLVMVSLPRPDALRVLGSGLPAVIHGGADAWKRWWSMLGSTKGTKLLFSSSTAGKDALDVSLEKKRQISYVKDFELEGNIGSPVLAQLEAGLFMKFRPVLSRDGAHVTFDFDVRVLDVVRPIAVEEKTVGGVKVRIQVPEKTESRQRTSLTLPLDGCGAFLYPRKGDYATIVFVRARLGAPLGLPKLPIPEAEVGVIERR
jgi:hypothetical protein